MKIFGFEISRVKQEQNPGEAPLFPDLRWTGTGFTLWAGDNPREYVEKGYAGNSTIYSIVTTCARKFSSVPWYVYKSKKPSSMKRLKALTGSYNEAALFNAQRIKGEDFDEISEGPMNELLERPNGYQSFGEFMEQLLAFKMVTGAAPVYLNMGAAGNKLAAMYVLPTQFVKLWPDSSLTYIDKAAYTITGSDYPLPTDQLLYWKYHNPLYSNDGSHLYGLSPLKAALLNLTADNYAVEASAHLFKNKGANGTFVPTDKPVSGGVQADTLRKDLDELMSGTWNRGKTPYVNHNMSWVTFGMSSQELDLMNARRLSKEDFANIYNYPIVLLNAERSTDNNMSHAIKYILTNTIYSELVSWRDHMNAVILPKVYGSQASQYFVDFDITAMPEMSEDTNKIVEYLRDSWWLTPNERRSVMKYDAIQDGYSDTIYLPGGLTPISLVNDGPDPIDPALAYDDEEETDL